MDRWVGKTAVVTGASAGIGAAICVALADAGMKVVGLARRAELVEDLKSEVSGSGEIHALQCDVGKPEQITEAFETVEQDFGGADVLVNNAALFPQGHITEAGDDPLSDDVLAQMIDVNITGLILSTRRAVASMKKRGVEGHIININSVAGHYVPSIPVANIYPATKHAVTTFTTLLTDELAHTQTRIKTTSLSPGLVDTFMGRNFTESKSGGVVLPMLRPTDVASAVIYAVSTPPDVNILELTIAPLAEKRC